MNGFLSASPTTTPASFSDLVDSFCSKIRTSVDALATAKVKTIFGKNEKHRGEIVHQSGVRTTAGPLGNREKEDGGNSGPVG